MLALLYKDYLLLRKYFVFMIPLAILFVAIAGTPKASHLWLVPTFGLLFTFIFGFMSVGFDDKDKAKLFYLSSPASVTDYVLSKYGLSWIIGFLSVLATIIVGSLDPVTTMKTMILVSALSFAAPLFIQSFMLPPILYLGEEKGRIVVTVMYILIFLGMRQIPRMKAVVSLLDKLPEMKTYPWGPGLILFVSVLLIHLLSITLSVKLMKMKEY